MAVAFAVWSLELNPAANHEKEINCPADLRITNVALGAELAASSGRTTLKLVYIEEEDEETEDEDEDEDNEPELKVVETVLCTLIPGQIEQVNVDIIIPKGRTVVFACVGKNTVNLSGNLIDQFPDDESDMDQPPSDDELDYDMSDADSELDDSDEEEEPKAAAKPESKKRAHDADASEAAENLSKKQKKQKKAASGEAVPAGGAEEPADAKKSKKAKDSSAKEEKQPEAKGKGVERVLAGGVKISDHRVGSGPKAKKGDTVSMRYIGKLANGKLFDSNTKGKAFEFKLGTGQVIKGWDVAIVGMQAGGERLITIPPAMGYGNKGQSGIPANSTLIFEVKLLHIKS